MSDGQAYIFRWMRAVRDHRDIRNTTGAIALVLATYADVNGRHCFPGMETIAAGAGLKDTRTARRHVQALMDAGLVVERVRGRKMGAVGRSTEYELTIPVPARESGERDQRDGTEHERPAGAHAPTGTTNGDTGSDFPAGAPVQPSRGANASQQGRTPLLSSPELPREGPISSGRDRPKGTSDTNGEHVDESSSPVEGPRMAAPAVNAPHGDRSDRSTSRRSESDSPPTGKADPSADTRRPVRGRQRGNQTAKKRTAKTPTQHPLPETWRPGPELIEWANSDGHGHVNYDDATAQFIDYNIGKGNLAADWGRMWKTWIRNAAKRSTASGARTGPLQENAADRRALETLSLKDKFRDDPPNVFSIESRRTG